MSEWLHCAICGREYEVSYIDPDSTLSEIAAHIRRHERVVGEPLLQVREGRAP